MATEIKLTKNKVVQVDAKDYEMLAKLKKKWCMNNGYAFNSELGGMHRFLLSAPAGLMVDHRNGNKLDNRRENLRLCTNSQNQANRQKICGASPFKGVTWQCRPDGTGSWKASVTVKGVRSFLGTFDTDLEAAKAYNAALSHHFGEFAHLNDLNLPASAKKSVYTTRCQVNRGNPSGFKGVTFDAARKKWMAQLASKGVTHLKKRFSTAEEAAFAYDAAARTIYGPTAATNF